jgi:hypothetical protein
MKVNRLLMLESDLLALRPTAALAGSFRFAMSVGIAATVRFSKGEVLFARYAAAPYERQDEQQRNKRTGQRPQHSPLVYSAGGAAHQRDRRELGLAVCTRPPAQTMSPIGTRRRHRDDLSNVGDITDK